MYEVKTKEHDGSVIDFIENVESPKKREANHPFHEVFDGSLSDSRVN